MSIVARGLGHPTGLAVDMELDRLYWCNAHRRSKIEFAALDGRYRWSMMSHVGKGNCGARGNY